LETLRGGQPLDYPKKLFVCYHAFTGEGKTTQLLTFPPPLHFVNCGDRDIKHLIERLPDSYEIHYEWLVWDVDATAKAESYLERATAMKNLAIRNGGSFLMDGSDLFWDFVQAAKVSPGTALKYKPANEFMFGFWQPLTAASNLQVGVTALAQEIWEGASSTGRYSHGGWKHLDRYIETDVRMFIKEQLVAGQKPAATQSPTVTHAGYIEASKKAEHLLRRIFDNLSFASLYRYTFGEAYPEEEKLWKPG
jgi:hypothetical protein